MVTVARSVAQVGKVALVALVAMHQELARVVGVAPVVPVAMVEMHSGLSPEPAAGGQSAATLVSADSEG